MMDNTWRIHPQGSLSGLERGLQKASQGIFARLKGLLSGGTVADDLWDELEALLIEADAGVVLAEELVSKVKQAVGHGKAVGAAQVREALRQELLTILQVKAPQYVVSKPWVWLIVGVNGTGKTTTVARLANYWKQQGLSVVAGAADTFRAAAVDQLKAWGERAGFQVVAHRPGADPGAVAFDAVSAAKSRGIDLVLIDTAGRQHTRHNLMEELKKIARSVGRAMEGAPHEIMLVLDATTGQNGLVQARQFAEVVGLTGVIVTKLDGTAKGGVVVSICHSLKLPVRFVGVGEGLGDIVPFDPEVYVDLLLAPSRSVRDVSRTN